MTRLSIFAVAALTLVCAGPSNFEPVIAQQGITRTPLGTTDFPGGYQIVMGIAQIPANTCFDRHTHAGVESAYVLEGEVYLKIEGSPEKDAKAGSGVQFRLQQPTADARRLPERRCSPSTWSKKESRCQLRLHDEDR